jgi:hypothetical protein
LIAEKEKRHRSVNELGYAHETSVSLRLEGADYLSLRGTTTIPDSVIV